MEAKYVGTGFATILLIWAFWMIVRTIRGEYWRKIAADEFDHLREWAEGYGIMINWHTCSSERAEIKTFVLRRTWLNEQVEFNKCEGIKFIPLYKQFRRIRELEYGGLSSIGVRDMLSSIAHSSQLARKVPLNFWKGE